MVDIMLRGHQRMDDSREEAALWRALRLAARHPIRLLVALSNRIQDDGMLTVAAAMAYYFFFSLFPFLIFLLACASLLPIPGLAEWVLAKLAQFAPAEAYGIIDRVVRGLLAAPRGGLVSIGAALALWTASSAMASVIDGINRAYRVRDERPWWKARLQALWLTAALSILLILGFVLSVFGGPLAELIGRWFGQTAEVAALVLQWSVLIVVVTVVVTAINYAAPATPRRLAWVTPGSILFILGFAGFSALFSYYVANFAAYDATYGSLGAVIILLLWMYALAVFLLLGAELNALLEQAGREGRIPQAVPEQRTPPRPPGEGMQPGERVRA
jgi:membrane protein